MKLRTQNILYFGIYMTIVISLIFIIDFSLIKNHLKQNAEEELKLRCEKIHHTIQSSLNSAIENYLRGITEANLDIVRDYYLKYKIGDITEIEAKNAIQDFCSKQTIGTSGYIVAMENRNGKQYLEIHPYKRHEDCSETPGCEVWNQVRNGYTEYDWKNPEDNKYRKKVAYLKEFPEWNWVFGATSYKSEFTQLLNRHDLKNILTSEKIKESGYAILYDSTHKILYHPMLEKYQDESFLSDQSSIVEEILSSTGKISFYNWKNPNEKTPRKKYAYTQKIPEFDFYIVVTGYMAEIYKPLNKIVYITILLSVTAILLLLLAVFFYSRKVINPIHKIIDGIKNFYSHKIPFKIPETSVDEIKSLASSFSNMTKEINKQMEEKQDTIEKVQQINMQLEIAKEKAEESDRLKSAFLANMSHEIRTPMNGILGFTSLLKNPQLSGENQAKFIQIIEKSGERMLNTINDIIDISKIESGHIEVTESKFSVNKLLEELFIFFMKEAEEKNIQLIYKPGLSKLESIIISDKQKLESILINLIKNALKFTKKGTIKFGCKIIPKHEETKLEFYVEDTGIGIPAARMKAIFNRFEQSDIEDINVYEGSGLGLAISKSYAEMLNGNISVSSEEGVGTVFKITIPYHPFSKVPDKVVTNKINDLISETNWNELSVIIAEDDDISKQLFKKMFENKFKKIIFTSNGKETVEECRTNPDIDLILMDIKMPIMNGYQATREIRKFNKDIIIIAQSAYSLSGDREKVLEAGCNDFISKPIIEENLINIINRHIIKY